MGLIFLLLLNIRTSLKVGSQLDSMKFAIIILLVGLALVDSSPNGNLKNRLNKIPCAEGEGIKSCTCSDGTVVLPEEESCFQLQLDWQSCDCNDGSTFNF